MQKEVVVAIKSVDNRPLSRGKIAKNNIPERAESNAVFKKRMSNIPEFAGMGMNPGEIQLAFNISLREKISTTEIETYLESTIKKKRITESDVEHKRPSTENGNSLADQQRDKVLKLLIAREVIRTPEDINKPQGKSEWERVVVSMGDIGQPLEIVKKLLSRGASLLQSMQIAKLERTPSQEPIVRFAQVLTLTDGMITGDLSKLYQLIVICKDNNIELPSLAYYIVFEAFLNARESKKINPQDLALLNKCQELKDIVFKKKTGGSDNSGELWKLNGLENSISRIDDGLVYRMDTRGRYRIGPNGNKLYTPMGYNDGRWIAVDDYFDSYMQRARSRDRVERKKAKTQKGKRTNHRTVGLSDPIKVAS